MEKVPKREINNKKAIYLPHHAVVKEDRETTKVRVVYNASMKGSNGKSLNDHMLIGPRLQPDLRDIIIRWRVHPVCLTADIVKMYRQVMVNKDHVDYQRILWRDDAGSEINHFRLLTVTFGVASAPYLAVKALQQTAIDEGSNYPWASEKVFTDFYMDDLLTGAQNEEEAVKIYKEMNELLGKANFDLQKWTSNSNRVVQVMKAEKEKGRNEESEEMEVREGLKIKTDEIIKIVGLTWNRNDDSFHYVVKLPKLQEPVTKRTIISDISRFYDPLGWVGPSIIISKIIIQKLWLAGLDWDEKVPVHILNEWLTYRNELKTLSEIYLPRWVGTKISDTVVELHGFCDASNVAYAAVVYVRTVDEQGKVHVELITSKTRVAPVKQVSIPRLELCGAVLLTRLMVVIAKVMKIEKINLHAWCDSTVVLAWLNSHPSRWKVFVANRVSDILQNLDSHCWNHVQSKHNPADYASRGQHPSDLVNNQMWFKGPEFLHYNPIVHKRQKDITTDLEATKSKTYCSTVEETIWNRFSSWTRMIRVIAYCLRFTSNLKKKKDDRHLNYLSSQELRDAMNVCVKQCQAEYFKAEIDAVKRNENISKRSCLRALNPILDNDKILRVGGRLDKSSLNYNRKHPILLPKGSHLTNLVIDDAHKSTLHGGPQLMICYLQAKFWVIGCRQLVRSYYRKCVICVKNSAVAHNQLMGQLPTTRVTPTRAFKCSGVDYAGPIQIRTTKGRGHKSHKGYICLFVCMVTRAIHLEVVTELTSTGFLQAFKRFVSRRGYCTDLWSDNGTNFVGASRELKILFEHEKRSMFNEIAEALASNGCTWHFIPARSPNFGGLWEAGVKSVKYHLKRVIGEATLTYEEMSTVLAQVESCLNSRPLSVVHEESTDTDVTVLTPGHFLVGEPLVTPPDKNFEDSNVGSLKRWQYTQRMLQDFWRQWSKEYLTKFYHRYRWSSKTPQPKLGDVVLVKEDGLPPCRWLYGRVIATHPGTDDMIRVVTLKLNHGTVKRPISKLCLLPISE